MSRQVREIQFNYPRLDTVIQGGNAVASLLAQVDARASQRVVVLASQTLQQRSGILDTLGAALGSRLAAVCTDIPAHTPRPAVMQAIQRAAAAQADLLVSVGGGSVIDAAKVVQLALVQNVHAEAELLAYARFADGSAGPLAGDFSRFKGPSALRQIAIPTTLSGAEFSNNAGVTDPEKSLKEGYRGPDLCPQAILYDPELSRHTPDWLWMSTAVRSLDHAIEGYCSAGSHSYLEGHFLHAIRLFARYLPQTHDDPADLEARSQCQQAVWLACCGLGQVQHGASHGIGDLLGAVCGVPHGYTSCVMLPAVLQWNSAVNAERQRDISAALGRPGGSAGLAVRELVERLELPTSLQDVGVPRDILPRIAELAVRHPVVRRNPKPVVSQDDAREILELAWNS
jgi:maleylacetate reductase